MNFVDSNTGTRKVIGQATAGPQRRDLLASEDSALTLAPNDTVILPFDTPETMQDAALIKHTAQLTIKTNNLALKIPPDGYARGPASYSSSNPSVATIDNSGIVTPITAGTTLITVTIPGLNSRKVEITVTEQGGEVTTSFDYFVAGSLGAHLVAQMTALIGSQTPPANLPNVNPPPAQSLLNIFNADGTPNSSVWTGALDLTCIPSPEPRGGVLITPRDMIFANHASYNPNPVFWSKNGIATTMTVHDAIPLGNVGPYVGSGGDILVATFTNDVPAGITPAKLMPANFRSYLPNPQYGYPVLFTNQDRTLLIGDVTNFAYDIQAGASSLIVQPADLVRQNWWYKVRTGDSGSPAFHVIDDGSGSELVLIGNWLYASENLANTPIDADNIPYINDVLINHLHSNYTVTTPRLSGFPIY